MITNALINNTENIPTKKAKAAPKPKFSVSLLLVAIKCMSTLLTTKQHFNYGLNIMTALVSRMALKAVPEAINAICDCFSTIFKEDETGETTLEAIKLMSRFIKNKSYNVPKRVLETFLSLRLREELVRHRDNENGQDGANNKKRKKKDEKHVSRKMRKINKHEEEVEKEMREAEAVVDKEEREKRVSSF